MNRGVLESSPAQQLMTAGNPNWWNMSSGTSPSQPLMGHHQTPLQPQMTPYNPNKLSSWLESSYLLPEFWSHSQLQMGGMMMGEQERLEILNNHDHQNDQQHRFRGKMRLDDWQEQVLSHQQASMVAVDIKQQSKVNNRYLLSSPNSPPNKSCVTTTTTTSINSNDSNNNNNNMSERRHTHPGRSSECNSLENGKTTNKKPRLQPSSSQSTLKVRKEKLGGRVAALHQIVSPFGKTDTASVLSETIGYIRFLQNQIEVLSHPYFDATASRQQRHLVNDQSAKRRGASSSSMDNLQNAREEPKKDLRSRGLCLVPRSCTVHVGSDNGADYWTPALGSAGFH